MSIYHRIRRRLGKDTTVEITHTIPIYDYTVSHTNGDTSEVRAHGYNIDGAFARFYKYTDGSVWRLGGFRMSASGQVKTRVLDSIKEIKKEKVGETEFTAVVDKADGTVLEKDITTEATEL